jgi:hypothetical protein
MYRQRSDVMSSRNLVDDALDFSADHVEFTALWRAGCDPQCARPIPSAPGSALSVNARGTACSVTEIAGLTLATGGRMPVARRPLLISDMRSSKEPASARVAQAP